MKIKDKLILDIIDVNYMGRGVAKLDDFVIFVIGAVTGDKVEAEITEVKKKYCVAEVKKLINSSEYRVEAKCKNFEKCGGCALMNLKYDKQLEFKNNQVLNSFKKARVNIEDAKINEIIGMENPYRYRNKTAFAVRTDYKKSSNPVTIGTYGYRTHRLIDIDECLIQDEKVDILLRKIKKIIEDNKIESYDKRKKTGTIRHVVFRKNYLNEIMLIVVTSSEHFKGKEKFLADLSAIGEDVVTIIQNINTKVSSDILGRRNIVLFGKGTFIDKIFDKQFIVSPSTFLQVNHEQTEKLYDTAMRMADIKKTDTVLDLYCGSGTISLIAAKQSLKVLGIDIVRQSITDAKTNARINNTKNVRFVCGKVEEKLPLWVDAKIEADVILIDPPRVGCDIEAIKSMMIMKPKKIVYISCNPSTLTRDASSIIEAGYKISEIQTVDMFCHTSAVETVVLFEKR